MMSCSGPCSTCGNLGRCLATHYEDLYFTATKEELVRRLEENIFLDKADRNEIHKWIEFYEIEEKYAKKAGMKVPLIFEMQSDAACCIDKRPAQRIRFMLDGCDIHFVAEAPEDITLKQLLRQCDRIKPDWCACGIRSLTDEEEKGDDRFPPCETEIYIDYNDIQKANKDVACRIIQKKERI